VEKGALGPAKHDGRSTIDSNNRGACVVCLNQSMLDAAMAEVMLEMAMAEVSYAWTRS